MLNKLFFPLLFIFSFSASVAQEKSAKNLPIGVFDSGTGGLTVLEALLSLDAFNNTTGAPGADGKPDFEGEYFQYLADQANMPYGNYAAEGKTKLLQEHVIKNMDFLMKSKYDYLQSAQWINRRKQGVKMLVLACNTATAFALNEVKEFVAQSGNDLPVVGVINAGVKAALNYQQSNKGAIGVFATAGTVASNGYPRTIKEMAAARGMEEPVVVSQGGFGLADAIDRDYSFFDEKANAYRTDYKGPSLKNATYKIDTTLLSIYNFNRSANKLLCEFDNNGSCLDIQLNDPENYVRYHLVTLLENMRAQKSTLPLNTLILGCTHYPFMRDTISRVLHELYNYKKNGNYVYRSVLAEHVELVDPAVETAKEAYVALRALQLQNESVKQKDLFFITVPNLVLNEVKLQPDGWFTYQYKYGRKEGEGKKFVNFVPFDNKNVSPAIYERLKIALPETFKQIQLTITSN
ncbi:MAG: glutamate racemase [Chitinophagaceae bacterium]|jgi:glutamate racemase